MKIIYTILLLTLLAATFIKPQWKTNPNEDNFISVATSNQDNPAIASDGNDGAFIVWEDLRNYATNVRDIYIQKIDKDGNTLFSNDGIPVCTAEGDQHNSKIVESSDGSVIVFWMDDRTNFTNATDLYAQKIDANGNPLWAIDGVPVSEFTSQSPGTVYYFNIVPDDDGGAFAVWQRNWFGYDQIRAQRINSDGNILWGDTGTIVTDGARFDRIPQLIRDNLNGGIVTAFRGTFGYSIMAQRINPNGNTLWNQNGITVVPNGPQNECSITAGDIYSNGGLMAVSWVTSGPVNAQLIDTSGNKLWGENGIIVNNEPGAHSFPKIQNDFDENLLSQPLPGTIDSSFGQAGIVITPTYSTFISDLAIQPDGKIISAGSFQNSGYRDYAFARYNTDGTLDNTFGTDGIAIVAPSPNHDELNAIRIQPDGKIIAAGYEETIFAKPGFCLVRLNSNGTLDASFGNGGIVTTSIDSNSCRAKSVLVQNDGKILAAGTISNDAIQFRFLLTRYNPDGSLDISFGNDGIVITFNDNAFCYGIAMQQDGKIIAIGELNEVFNDDAILVRYNTDGTLDNSFGNNGILITDLGGHESIFDVIVQNDGKILVSGTAGSVGDGDFLIMRYNSDGSFDNTFGSNGVVTYSYTTTSDDGIANITLQNDGKIIVTGNTSWFGIAGVFLRYNSNGTMDSTFGTNGIVTIPEENYSLGQVRLQNDGKILLSGAYNFTVSRYYGGEKVISNYYLSWLDVRSNQSIYAQKLNNNGIPQWTQNGNLVSDKPNFFTTNLNTHQLLFNGKDFFSVFEGNDGIYAQSISKDGLLNWGNDAVYVSQQLAPIQVVGSGNSGLESGAILTFSSSGNPAGTGSNVYAKRINTDGTLGGIISSISGDNLAPTDFVLYQNYPNPFNPSTKISWQSPVSSHQTIKIYDVLGKEIATLVDEYKPAGSYEIDFNASGLSSGIYFYRIQAGNFIETKKMILLR